MTRPVVSGARCRHSLMFHLQAFGADEERMMRVLLTTIGIGTIALSASCLATPAFSQQMDGFGHVIPEKHGVVEYHQPARNDKAYKSALDQIPDAKTKYDPWGQVRQQPAGNNASK